MKVVNSAIEKAATLRGTIPSYERPKGEHKDPRTNEYHMAQIFDYTSHSEVTLPIVLEKAEGAYVWDVTGKKYIDMMASYGCANQGHGHPKIIDALVNQAKKLSVTSLVTHHNMLGTASKHLTQRFGYEKILFMNSGAEAVDTAVLTARRWAYEVKKVPDGQAAILFPKKCYWGMISSARAGTDDPVRREESGPLASDAQKYDFVTFDDVEELEAKFKANPNICAYIFEPIQGHAGNIHPTPGYYTKVRELCTKYNVLMVADEVQAGLGRTGKLFTCEWENVRPDMITIGKSLAGDTLPISAVLADNKIMDVWAPGTHISTYAANSLACAVAMTSVDVLFEDKLIENAEKLGKILEEEFNTYNYSFIKQKNAGKGLYSSIQLTDEVACWTVCNYLLEKGILVKPGTDGYLKVMPPLCISEQDFRHFLKLLKEGLEEYEKKGKLGLIVDTAAI